MGTLLLRCDRSTPGPDHRPAALILDLQPNMDSIQKWVRGAIAARAEGQRGSPARPEPTWPMPSRSRSGHRGALRAPTSTGGSMKFHWFAQEYYTKLPDDYSTTAHSSWVTAPAFV